MKSFTLVFALFIVATQSVEAKIRRVGYFGVAVPNTDYGSFALAHTAASANDTILIFPGAIASGNITKKLFILGTGNWLDPTATPKGNANQQAFASVALGGGMSFLTGSDGSIVSGLYFAGNAVYVGANNILIRRNRDLSVNLSYNPNAAANLPQTINNLQLLENYELTITYSYNIAGFTQTNLNVSNNLIETFTLNTTLNTYNGNISNNIWVYDATNAAGNGGASTYSNTNGIYLGNGAFLFQNNILVCYTNASAASNYNYFVINDGGNTVFNYNIILQSYNNIGLGTGIGNVVVPIGNVAAIFEDFPAIGTNSADGRYRLKAGSPGLIANRPGSSADAGIFGGTAPYKLSTLPSIPSIYSLSSPQGNNPTGSTIQINVSAKGNN
jgi:hypothetical protein